MHEVLKTTTKCNHGLAKMNEFSSAFSDDMYTEELSRFTMKYNLKNPISITADVTTGVFAVSGNSYFIRAFFLRKFSKHDKM